MGQLTITRIDGRADSRRSVSTQVARLTIIEKGIKHEIYVRNYFVLATC